MLVLFSLSQIFELNGANVGVQVTDSQFLQFFIAFPTRNNVVKLSSTNSLFCPNHFTFTF